MGRPFSSRVCWVKIAPNFTSRVLAWPWLLALASDQLFFAHRGAWSIATNVNDLRGLRVALLSFQPGLGVWPNAQDHSLDLSFIDLDCTILKQTSAGIICPRRVAGYHRDDGLVQAAREIVAL